MWLNKASSLLVVTPCFRIYTVLSNLLTISSCVFIEIFLRPLFCSMSAHLVFHRYRGIAVSRKLVAKHETTVPRYKQHMTRFI